MKTFKRYVELCKSYMSSKMILNVKIDAKMVPKSCTNGSKMSKMEPKWMVTKCSLGGLQMSQEASRWLKRCQDGLNEASMTPKMAQMCPKMAHMTPNMAPRGAKMAPKDPRWRQGSLKMVPRGLK